MEKIKKIMVQLGLNPQHFQDPKPGFYVSDPSHIEMAEGKKSNIEKARDRRKHFSTEIL